MFCNTIRMRFIANGVLPLYSLLNALLLLLLGHPFTSLVIPCRLDSQS
jgi:hypothetical protein